MQWWKVVVGLLHWRASASMLDDDSRARNWKSHCRVRSQTQPRSTSSRRKRHHGHQSGWKCETLGEEQYAKFVTERLEQCTTPITQTIPKDKSPLFSRPPVNSKSKQKEQLAALKNDIGLFSRMILTIYSSMKTWQLCQLFQQEGNYCLGLKQICFTS